MSGKIKIQKVELFDKEVLIEKLRKVTMLKNQEAYPYENAEIILTKVPVKKLHPPQCYVLKDNILRARELEWSLKKHSINLFNLNGFARIWLEDEKEPIDLLPPIIEKSIEENGEKVYLVCDGMHRVYLAHLEWKIPQVVIIKNIPKEYPYYAYPLADKKWNNIEIREDIPEGYIKKWHRIEDNKKLYRNFNSTFINVGGPRGNFVKS